MSTHWRETKRYLFKTKNSYITHILGTLSISNIENLGYKNMTKSSGKWSSVDSVLNGLTNYIDMTDV